MEYHLFAKQDVDALHGNTESVNESNFKVQYVTGTESFKRAWGLNNG